MAFVLELKTTSSQAYITNYIISIIRSFGINAGVRQERGRIICAFDSKHSKLHTCLEAVAQGLPASCFLTGSQHYDIEDEPKTLPEYAPSHPLGLGLCPACQKEMFDPSSRRYYYPFTSCSHCGGQYGFFDKYPYTRANTSFNFIRPCKDCEEETASIGFREKQQLNSCHSCGVPVRLMNKNKERYANDPDSFRMMFDVAAKAIADKKRVLIKTTMGYRLFYTSELMQDHSILMMINASKITDCLSLITQEFNALLSIERPVLDVAIKDESLKAQLGNSVHAKYPDDGFSILLAAQLQKLGLDYCGYEVADETTDTDILMDYNLKISAQNDMRLFLNKDIQFIAEGERVSFPAVIPKARNVLSLAHKLISVENEDKMLLDTMEHFERVNVVKAVVLEGETEENLHNIQQSMSQDEASFMSVIAENKMFGVKCIGAYFDEEPSFLYYNGKKVIRIIPTKAFHPEDLLEKMRTLREGSDRLVDNFKEQRPEIYEKLLHLQERKGVRLFEATAILLGLDDESMRGVVKEAMRFVGKGGIQIDTRVKDNHFEHIAFLTSIMSYQLAGVGSSILSYSIFESFGDYFSEIIQELKSKTKAEITILCGSHFANQSLFSRMQRNLKQSPPLMNINFPIGKENAVVGGIYL